MSIETHIYYLQISVYLYMPSHLFFHHAIIAYLSVSASYAMVGPGLVWEKLLLWLFAKPLQQLLLLSKCGKAPYPFSEAFAFPKEIQLG